MSIPGLSVSRRGTNLLYSTFVTVVGQHKGHVLAKSAL